MPYKVGLILFFFPYAGLVLFYGALVSCVEGPGAWGSFDKLWSGLGLVLDLGLVSVFRWIFCRVSGFGLWSISA